MPELTHGASRKGHRLSRLVFRVLYWGKEEEEDVMGRKEEWKMG